MIACGNAVLIIGVGTGLRQRTIQSEIAAVAPRA